METKTHRSISHNHRKVETTQASDSGCKLNKLWSIHRGMSLRHDEAWSSDTLDAPGRRSAERENTGSKQYCVVLFRRHVQNREAHRTTQRCWSPHIVNGLNATELYPLKR